MIVGYGRVASRPENECNTCSPAIPDTLYVTFGAQLSGDFAPWIGKNTLEWFSGCQWRWDGDPGESIILGWVAGNWNLNFQAAGAGCQIQWVGGSTACDPTEAYSWNFCGDSLCDDPDSCEDSAGATCVVTLT